MPVSKSRRKKIAAPGQGPAKSKQAVTLPDRRAMERFIADLAGQPRNESLAKAQELMYDAWDQGSVRARIALAHKALAISPLCADAYNLLAEEAASAREAHDLYAKAVEAGTLALGPEGFEDYAGRF